jgi:hypothetical protein
MRRLMRYLLTDWLESALALVMVVGGLLIVVNFGSRLWVAIPVVVAFEALLLWIVYKLSRTKA